MVTKGHEILTLDIESLLNGSDQYVIPVYQRNYAWQEAQITQLIQDIIDYIPKEGNVQDYYIGTLVAYERKQGASVIYETIDGQQRVTTLTLLTSVIRHFYPSYSIPWFNKINLDFESRKSSSDTLHHIYTYGENFSPNYSWNESVVAGFQLCKELLRKKLAENNIDIQLFADYLFKRVKILRVTVPEDTDLNHYFEIMNNRGEQLEKHEILKSKFLELLNALEGEDRDLNLSVFNLVWEACASMEKYVQYGFGSTQRDQIFGADDWNTLVPTDFFELVSSLRISLKQQDTVESLSLVEIIQGKSSKIKEKPDDDTPERFNTVVNFPNFLLHVLRVYTRKDIPLDDKRLITTFEAAINEAADKVVFAQEFGYELLRCKFLFDKYIIKREFIGGIDRWSLKKLKRYKESKVSYINTFGAAADEMDDDNRSVLMLLSMFHVSTPTLVYKHWLNAALYYLVQKNDIMSAAEYKRYLIATARSFVYDRFLAKGLPRDYYEIIYQTNGKRMRAIESLALNKLVFDAGIENIVFNYLDYLLWERYKKKNKRVNEFEFSFRSSVEHYYPRNPMPGYKGLNRESLDSIGNLCLISHSKNSRLSNQPPIAKKSHYKKQQLESIKQWVMMEEYNPDEWNEAAIADHEQKMVSLLTEDINSDYEQFADNSKISDLQDKAIRWFKQYRNDSTNRALLVRAILCFGEVAKNSGNTFFMDKYHSKFCFYDWEHIQNTEAFKQFCVHVNERDPASLSAIIQNEVNGKECANDPYLKVFVQHPSIWEYMQQGYFTWINDGEQVLLHEKERNVENGSRDLLIHLVMNWFLDHYKVDSYVWRDGFMAGIAYSPEQGAFYFSSIEDAKGYFMVDCEEPGKIRCRIKPNRNSSNSSFVRGLTEYGWQNIIENYYQKGNTPTICVTTKDYDYDFSRIKDKLQSIIVNGLGIKL